MGDWMPVYGKARIKGKIDPTKVFGKITPKFTPPERWDYNDISDFWKDWKRYIHDYEEALLKCFEHENEYVFSGSEGTAQMKFMQDKETTTVWIYGAIRDNVDQLGFIDWFVGKLPKETIDANAHATFFYQKTSWNKAERDKIFINDFEKKEERIVLICAVEERMEFE